MIDHIEENPMAQAATATKPAEPAPPSPIGSGPKLFKPLPANRLKVLHASSADYGNVLGIVVPADVRLEHLLDPSVWSTCASTNLIRANDVVEVRWDSQRAFARLYVRDVSGTGNVKSRVVVSVLEHIEFEAFQPVRDAITHFVEHRGPHLKFCVIEAKTGRVVSDGHETVEIAHGALRNIVRQDPPKA
jgi:hypothetical protein